MILLDTDHLSVLKYVENPKYTNLRSRMQAARDQLFATTIISVEEQLRGWLAQIHRARDVRQQLFGYERLADLLEFFRDLLVVRFEARAADEFDRLRKQRVRIGTMDLKIASIARVHGVLLLTANLRDFRQVPGLTVENWLD
jgi:tRNA(fMet)-specific endonuclease VapC